MTIEIEEINYDCGFTLILSDGELTFGRAHVIFNDDRKAQLAYITINDSEFHPYPLLKLYKKKIRYRRQGYVTRLLNEVISRCNSKGVVEIVGNIHGDPKVLIPWYEKNGFTVSDKNGVLLITLKMFDWQ